MAEDVVYIVNPKRKRRATKRARTASGRFVRRRRVKRRRNPVGGTLMTVNPKRRRRSTRRRRAYRRNPRRRGIGRAISLRGVKPIQVMYNVAGLVAAQTLTPMVLKMARQPETGVYGIVGKIATSMIGAFLLDQFMRQKSGAQAFMQGGLISVGTDIWNVYVKPRIGLAGMYEFESAFPAGDMGGAYMFDPMDQSLLGNGCPPSARYLAPTHQVTVPAGVRMAEPVGYPERYRPNM